MSSHVTSKQKKKSVLIVGAGPAGGLLAFLLAREGIPVTLIERHSDFNRVFRGEGLMPSGLEMFKQAGLWAQFKVLPHSQFKNVEIFYKKKLLAKQSLKFSDDILAPRFVSQPHMLEMLVKASEKFENFTFIKGARVTQPIYENKRVIGVKIKNNDDEETLKADYTFATDGRYSVLRKKTGLETPQNPEFFDIIWFKLPKADFLDHDKKVRAYFGDGHLGLFIPSYDALQIGWIIKKGHYKNFKKMGIEGWITEMSTLVSDDMAQFLKLNQHNFTQPFLLDVISDFYKDWSVPGLTLLGDAAHPMSPVGGQGINIALRDSVIAANHFIPLLKHSASGKTLDQAAKNFAAERYHEVMTIKNLQRRPPRLLLGTGLKAELAILLIKGLQKTGLSKVIGKRFQFENTPFSKGVTEVKLEKFDTF